MFILRYFFLFLKIDKTFFIVLLVEFAQNIKKMDIKNMSDMEIDNALVALNTEKQSRSDAATKRNEHAEYVRYMESQIPVEPEPEEPVEPEPEEPQTLEKDFGKCLMQNGILFSKDIQDELVTFHKFISEETNVKPEFIPGRFRPRNGAPIGYIYKNKTDNGMPAGYYLETGATADRLIDNLIGLRDADIIDLKRTITCSIRLGVNPTIAFNTAVQSYGYLIQVDPYNNSYKSFIPSTFTGPMTNDGYLWRSGKQGQGYYRYDTYGVLYRVVKIWSEEYEEL